MRLSSFKQATFIHCFIHHFYLLFLFIVSLIVFTHCFIHYFIHCFIHYFTHSFNHCFLHNFTYCFINNVQAGNFYMHCWTIINSVQARRFYSLSMSQLVNEQFAKLFISMILVSQNIYLFNIWSRSTMVTNGDNMFRGEARVDWPRADSGSYQGRH